MKRRLLFAYQAITGISDTGTGLMLIFAPVFTLRLMQLHVPPDAVPFLSYIGAFVFSVGIACFYGGYLTIQASFAQKLEAVWLLTAITRGSVAIFILIKIFTGILEPGWTTVAITDGSFTLLQAFGLWKGWLANVER